MTEVLLRVILTSLTKRTAISLPDQLYREIERARKRSKKDRSTWIQEAASEYLKRRTEAEDVEAYFAAYERAPLGDDELAAIRYAQTPVGRIIDALDRK